jgi:glutamate-ammonia-ligase adenylyltransferase
MTMLSLHEHWQAAVDEYPELKASAESVLSASNYVMQWGISKPTQLKQLLSENNLLVPYPHGEMRQRLASRLSDIKDEADLQQKLRQFRQQQMARIIWRDIAGWSDLAETMTDLSAMADACIQLSLHYLSEQLASIHGQPLDEHGNPQQMIVLGMGKLGAGELNLSSDIDLIFVYPDSGETQGGRRPLSHEEYFMRLGRKLIQSLNTQTVDGFVFRVDMRLRPFGESGALVHSFDGIEDYYLTQGREWERYAMIKARMITGREEDKKVLHELLRPFVFRRYLDYGVFESLREMKSMIAGQLHRKGMEDNIKLGAGGIREIEFIGQVFQLIYGGRDAPLQQRPILTILDLLAERGLLSNYAVSDLKEAYEFLRRTEHRIQAWADQQTHILPNEIVAQTRLAKTMGFETWAAFEQVMIKYRQQVHAHFDQLLVAPQAESVDTAEHHGLMTASEEEKLNYLTNCGYDNPSACLEVLDGLLSLHGCKHLSEVGRQRFERLLPLLIQAAAQVEEADQTLKRLMPLLEAIMRRTAYMSLLVENPMALSQLIKLCAASVWISHQLARFPVLLDELLDPRSLYQVPDREAYAKQLDHFLETVEEDDLEQFMIVIREFRQIATLHVAAADVTDVLPLMHVGDRLTDIAELLLAKVWASAWRYITQRHGYPECVTDDRIEQCGLSILAYGKLGGLELGYGSDLDLVIIYDDAITGVTNGDKPVDVMVFYTRLVQRMIHIMNAITTGGQLYEVDMRLRPSGASGLLVSPFSGFETYQHKEAWTWEHQALVRARCVLGDAKLNEKVTTIRNEVLAQQRDLSTLKEQVVEMRFKMRQQLDKSTDSLFDLKQGHGGMTDIEFLVQYAVLAWSSNLPELLLYTDNIRILQVLVSTGKLEPSEGEILAEAYRHYRSEANHCVLQEQTACVPFAQTGGFPQQVQAIWQQWLG